MEDDVKKSINEIEKHEQLEVKIGALVDKIQKLKHKKRTMEEIVTSLKLIMQSSMAQWRP